MICEAPKDPIHCNISRTVLIFVLNKPLTLHINTFFIMSQVGDYINWFDLI